jgi:hypothetical protein
MRPLKLIYYPSQIWRGGQVDTAHSARILPDILRHLVTYISHEQFEQRMKFIMAGHTIARAVSHWHSTVVAQVQSQVRLWGICDKSVTEATFLQVHFGFTCEVSFHQLLSIHYST